MGTYHWVKEARWCSHTGSRRQTGVSFYYLLVSLIALINYQALAFFSKKELKKANI
ncbi:hypothetical protein KSD_31290 [Ktedonobacter sp. SOSP1-85]|nr:hypothetical protein KSD_31290 [Ktedonobacter sp. SOSP1-85]